MADYCISRAWAFAAALAASVAFAQPAPTTVTLKESGETVELVVGQEIQVRLESNPSTGFGWSVPKGGQPKMLRSKGARKYEPPPATAGSQPGVGAPGLEVWSFTAKSRGTQTLRFEYRRGFEADVAPARKASYRVTVK